MVLEAKTMAKITMVLEALQKIGFVVTWTIENCMSH